MTVLSDLTHEQQVAYWRDTVRGELLAEIERLQAALQEAAADLVGCCTNPDDPFVAQALRRIADARMGVQSKNA